MTDTSRSSPQPAAEPAPQAAAQEAPASDPMLRPRAAGDPAPGWRPPENPAYAGRPKRRAAPSEDAPAESGSAEAGPEGEARLAELRLGSRRLPLPRNKMIRIGLGVLLVLFGLVGFLPVLGFWMIPLGIAVLSYDVPAAERLRERVASWWRRRRERDDAS